MVRKPKPSGRYTRARPLKRSAGSRLPFPRIVVVCEGEKTEPNYLNAIRRKFRLSSVRVIVHSGTPEEIVRFAINGLPGDEDPDEVWCVFDVEHPSRKQLIDSAVSLAKSEKIQLAVSNPAFEFWLLLHFEMTDRPFQNAHEVIAELMICLPDYQKNYPNCENLLRHLDDAISRARQVIERHVDQSFAPNPSTYMHLLAHRLKTIRQKES